ncbi:MULE transposase domain [Popillia japonica]|uniref:MULE transposase domain n=1 Tax=Popillia japonica TaxID=7064 RepID=A0AAW1L7F1_POPJA
METVLNKGYEFVSDFTLYQNAKPSLYQARREAQGDKKDSKDTTGLIFTENMLHLDDGTSFLLSQLEDKDKLLVFCNTEAKEALKSHKRFFMDETFKSCAKQYKQLYTIHVDLGSSSTKIKIVPVLFALLCNKSCATYTKLFQIIKKATSWNPYTVSVDFEQAAITSLKTIYPTVAK